MKSDRRNEDASASSESKAGRRRSEVFVVKLCCDESDTRVVDADGAGWTIIVWRKLARARR